MFRGDGILSIVRKSGEIQHFYFGSHRDTLSSLTNKNLSVLTISDIVGGEIILESGDLLLLSSDGLGRENKIDRISQLYAQSLSDDELEQKIADIIWETETIEDDDKSLVVYQQK